MSFKFQLVIYSHFTILLYSTIAFEFAVQSKKIQLICTLGMVCWLATISYRNPAASTQP